VKYWTHRRLGTLRPRHVDALTLLPLDEA